MYVSNCKDDMLKDKICEVSTGKTSIAQLLLGIDLPTSPLHTTKVFCHLRDSNDVNKKYAKLKYNDGQTLAGRLQSLDLTITGNMETLQKLIKDEQLSDIYIQWPIDLLKGHVTIVDTPGLAPENERVMDYLPKAAAFIYLVNTDVTESDLSKDIMKERLKADRESASEGQTDYLVQVDSELSDAAIFVLNKWEDVNEKNRDDVRKKVLSDLQSLWPHVTDDQLHPFSAKEAKRCLDNGAGPTKQLSSLLKAIQTLIPISLERKSRRYFNALGRLIKAVESEISKTLSTAKLDMRELRELQDNLELLEKSVKSEMNDLIQKFNSEYNGIVNTFYEHIHHEDVVKDLSTWDPAKVPDGKTMDEVNKLAEVAIAAKLLADLVVFRDRTKILVDFHSKIKTMYTEKVEKLAKIMEKWDKTVDTQRTESAFDVSLSASVQVEGWFKRLIITLTSWIPYFGTKIRKYFELKTFRKTGTAIMEKRTKEAIEKLDRKALQELFLDQQIVSLRNRLESLKNFLEKTIENDRERLTNRSTSSISSKDVIKRFTPLRKDCNHLTSKRNFLELRHFDKNRIPISNVTFGENELGRGQFGVVYDGQYNDGHEVRNVAIKVLDEKMRKDVTEAIATESYSLRKLQHRNVVVLHGVVCEDTPKRCFYIVTEVCLGSLNKLAFGEPNRISAMSKADTVQGQLARCFFKKMMSHILSGLQFIHSEKFIHRDMKLSNVLLTSDEVAKITDMGFAALQLDVTNTFCGTPNHMAPEIFLREYYDKAIDIYSVAVMMWELWYGKDAFGGINVSFPIQRKVFDHDGERPTDALIDAIMQCWEQDQYKRPKSAGIVKDNVMAEDCWL